MSLSVVLSQETDRNGTSERRIRKQQKRVNRAVVCTMLFSVQVLLVLCIFHGQYNASSIHLTTIKHQYRQIITTTPSGNPKVALLFLTTGPIHNEPIWRVFFEAAARLTLRDSWPDGNGSSSDYKSDSIQQEIDDQQQLASFAKRNQSRRRLSENLVGSLNKTACMDELYYTRKELTRLLYSDDEASGVIDAQSLFSVYVHPGIRYTFPRSSLFYRKEIENRVDTEGYWSTFRLIDAELQLLKAALGDLLNWKFVLLSPSCVPLYTPEVLYAQIMSEIKSRVDACDLKGTANDDNSYDHEMTGKLLNKSMWRKSSQWFSLTRSHAITLISDVSVFQSIKEHCDGWQSNRLCVPDEHYIPTVLAIRGLQNETDCIGRMTFYQFGGGAHAYTFHKMTISPEMMRALRHQDGECNVAKARSTAVHLFDGIPSENRCLYRNITQPRHNNGQDSRDLTWVEQRGYEPLGYDCVLFARKFPDSVVEQTLSASLSCAGSALGHWYKHYSSVHVFLVFSVSFVLNTVVLYAISDLT